MAPQLMSRECSVSGCWHNPHARGMCARHYRRWWRHRDPTAVQTPGPKTKPKVPCGVPGCDRDHHARGMCMTHYSRWWRAGKRGDIRHQKADEWALLDASIAARKEAGTW